MDSFQKLTHSQDSGGTVYRPIVPIQSAWVDVELYGDQEKVRQGQRCIGDIPRVTPSSKVVVYLAQLMVSQDISLEDVSYRAKDLAIT